MHCLATRQGRRCLSRVPSIRIAGASCCSARAPRVQPRAALVTAPGAEATHQGYRETEHVRNYYATTRI